MSARKALPFHYEKHALSRLQERKVDKKSIEDAILDPHWTAPGDKDGRIKLGKRVDRKTCINVVIEKTPKFIRIISAWWVKE